MSFFELSSGQQAAIDALSETSSVIEYDPVDVTQTVHENGAANELGIPIEDPEIETEPITMIELLETHDYATCFACRYITTESLHSNKRFLALMHLYTKNYSIASRDAIFNNIKRFYDAKIRDQLPTPMEWTLESIRAHFTTHTKFPTDEIALQIQINESMRNKLTNHIIRRNKVNGSLTFDTENAKLMVTLQREIQNLLKMRKDIPTMYGYNQVLDF